MPVMMPPVRKLMRLGHAFEKSYDGLTTLAATLVVSVASASATSMMIRAIGLSSLPVRVDRVPDRIAEHDHGGRRGDDADEREQGHGGRQAQRLTDGLVTLAAAEPGEVGHVEGQGGPERDHAHERDREDRPEVRAPAEGAGLLEDRAEAAGLDDHPDHEGQEDDDQERGGPALEPLDRLHAPQDDDHVEGPEDREAEPRGPRLGGRVTDAERDRRRVGPPGGVAVSAGAAHRRRRTAPCRRSRSGCRTSRRPRRRASGPAGWRHRCRTTRAR